MTLALCFVKWAWTCKDCSRQYVRAKPLIAYPDGQADKQGPDHPHCHTRTAGRQHWQDLLQCPRAHTRASSCQPVLQRARSCRRWCQVVSRHVTDTGTT